MWSREYLWNKFTLKFGNSAIYWKLILKLLKHYLLKLLVKVLGTNFFIEERRIKAQDIRFTN